jgi:membrane protease YdiL (CAAX protease family)
MSMAALPGSAHWPPPPAAPALDRHGWRTGAPVERNHRWGLGAYLLVELVFLAASAAIGILVVGGGTPRAGALAIALTVPTLLAAGLALLITKVRGNGPRTDLRLRWSAHDLRMGLAFGAGGLFVTLPASMIYIMIVGRDATSAVGEVFGGVRASVPLAVFIFLAVVLVAPVCEEIVYRGLLWGAVERLGAGRWVALAVTTLLFALAHFEFTRTPLLLVVAVPIALARLYTDGLLASIIAHQVNNLLPGIALALGLIGVIPMV